MRDVAQRAGVSSQTVSRAVRGTGLVAPATLARVRAAMAELGYMGNEAAGALKRGQTYIIGLLCPLLTTPFWSDVAAGAESQAHASGYSLLLCDTSDSLEKEAGYISLLLSHRVAGIMYVVPRCRPETHAACAALLRAGVPVVVISSDPKSPLLPRATDDVRAGYVAARHLLDLGRRRIALVCSTCSTGDTFSAHLQPGPADLDRLIRSRNCVAEAGLGTDDVPVLLVQNTMEGGHAVGEALLRDAGSVPDGLLVTVDTVALGVLEVLRAHDVRIPEQVAIVAHDGLLESSVSVLRSLPLRRRAKKWGARAWICSSAPGRAWRCHLLKCWTRS